MKYKSWNDNMEMNYSKKCQAISIKILFFIYLVIVPFVKDRKEYRTKIKIKILLYILTFKNITKIKYNKNANYIFFYIESK